MIAALQDAAVRRAPLIAATDTWTLWSVILCGVAMSIFMEQRYRWAARLSGPVLGLLIAMALSTSGVMPTKAAAYDFIGDYLVPLAIPLLLFRADLLRIIRVAGTMFVAFHVAVVGTVLGAMVATLTMQSQVENAPEIGGIMTASYSGGSVNFAAVKKTFQDIVGDRLTNSLLVADNFIMAGFFILLLVLAGNRRLLRLYPHPEIAQESGDAVAAAAEHWAPKPIGLRDIALALAIAFTIASVAHATSALFTSLLTTGQTEQTAEAGFTVLLLGNVFVWITVFSLACATAFPRFLGRIAGAEELGSYLLYIYLFSIGLPANLVDVLYDVPAMFGYCAIMAVVNLAVTLGLGKLLKLNLEDLLISVNATLGGAPSAVAMAVSKGWSRLVLPAMLVGIWGYVIGTAVGITTAKLLGAMVR